MTGRKTKFHFLVGGVVLATCLASCTVPLVGALWSEISPNNFGQVTPQSDPDAFRKRVSMRFFSDGTCSYGEEYKTIPCKYSIVSDGIIKIEIDDGRTLTGRRQDDVITINEMNTRLSLAGGPLKLYMW